MNSESALRIGALLPDVLGTYSDRGNVTVLAQRARWRGLPVEVVTANAEDVPPTDCDLYVIGGGEDAPQRFGAEWLRKHRALCAAIADRATTLAVCAGMQVLGASMEDSAGRVTEGAGVLPLTTVPGRIRAVGEVVTECALPGVGLLTGFENHRGVTTLEPGVAALGHTVRGVGNGAGDGGEGVLTKTVVGTYLHGPVLARNPALADALLEKATGLTLEPLELPDQEAVRRLRLRTEPGTGGGLRGRLFARTGTARRP
jgi:CobQ-like glutamine amidotransferase family enzyme